MNIDKKIEEKKEEFDNLLNKRQKISQRLSQINERLVFLKGEYSALKKVKEYGKKD